jgi:hypothetical protein
MRLNVVQDGSDESVIFCNQNNTQNDDEIASNCLLLRRPIWLHVDCPRDTKDIRLCPRYIMGKDTGTPMPPRRVRGYSGTHQ